MNEVIPMSKPPEVLAERAREFVETMGYSTSALDYATGFTSDESFISHLTEVGFGKWGLIKSGQPLVIHFWYRQSPRYMVPQVSDILVSELDPPMDVSGMTTVALDTRGRLVRSEYHPPQVDPETETPPSKQSRQTGKAMFTAAGLTFQNFKQVPSKWIPPSYADDRIAWEGPRVDHPEIPIRIEAAAFKAKPVHFIILFPWDKPLRQEEWQTTSGRRVAAIILTLVFFGVLFGAALLGRRNIQLGRSDKKGAFRLAFFVFGISEVGGSDRRTTFPGLIVRVNHCLQHYEGLAFLRGYHLAALHSSRTGSSPSVATTHNFLDQADVRKFPDRMVGRDLLIGRATRSSAIQTTIMIGKFGAFVRLVSNSPPGA